MLPEWGQAGFMILLALIFPIGGIGSSWALGLIGIRPQNPDRVKEATYECGVETEGDSWVQFNFRYYLVALIFVIFDVEVVFLYPWAVMYRSLGLFGFFEMLMFVFVLALGFVYVWRKGALEWA